MSVFLFKDLPEIDLGYLRKNRCPWCMSKLSPIFERDKHVGDECLDCKDQFRDAAIADHPDK